MLFYCKTSIGMYDIEIDPGYILISKIPMEIVTRADDDLFDRLFEHDIIHGFDRCDGEDYYKDYEDPELVGAIEDVIEKHPFLSDPEATWDAFLV